MLGHKIVTAVGCVLLSGCAGITTLNTRQAPLNAVLPLDELKNDVQDPSLARVDLGSYCGHLVERKSSGFRPLGILASPLTSPPQIVAATDEPIIYYSLFDAGGKANLDAAWGPVGGGFVVNGQDRLEVTVRMLSFCKAADIDVTAIQGALQKLAVLAVDRQNVFLVGTAAVSQISVETLHAISSDAKLAVTPIVNIGGNVYSKEQTTKKKYAVALSLIPINTALAAPTGTQLTATPAPVTSPPATAVAASPSAAPSAAATGVSATMLSADAFRASYSAAKQSPTLVVRR